MTGIWIDIASLKEELPSTDTITTTTIMSSIDDFEPFNYEAVSTRKPISILYQFSSLIESMLLQPGALVFIGSILRGPRSGFGTRFADSFSDDLDTQRSYARGILSVAYFFVIILVVWSFILIVLKIKGTEVGCASGLAFHMEQIENDEDEFQETDSSSGDESNGAEPIDVSANERSRSGSGEGGHEVALSDGGSNVDGDGEEMEDQSSWATELERARTNYPYASRMKETRLERKTRMCFLLCSIVSLCIVPFVLVFSFGPMKEATEAAKQAVMVRIIPEALTS